MNNKNISVPKWIKGSILHSRNLYKTDPDFFDEWKTDLIEVPNSWQKLESSWTPDRGTEKRGVGDPSTTAWKYTLNNGYSGGSATNYFRIWIKNSGPFGGLFVEKELRVDCP